MLSVEQYQKLYEFQNHLLQLRFKHSDELSFSQSVGEILDEVFGYDKSALGYMAEETGHVLDSSCMLHGVSLDFAQQFFYEYWRSEPFFQNGGDTIIFSQLPEFHASDMYRKVMKKNGFCDCALQFVVNPSSGRYTLYFIIFSEKKPFTNDDTQLLEKISRSIAYAQEDYLEMWILTNQNSMLVNYTNYFPIGIMLVERINQVTFTNDVAKRYLSDLGVTSPRMYNMFFTNKLYKYCKYDLINGGSIEPIRLKNYLFSIVSIGNHGKNLENHYNVQRRAAAGSSQVPLNFMVSNMDTSLCIYIINDNMYRTKFSLLSLEKAGLTKREMNIAELIAGGNSNQEIASQLGITHNTVRIHISNIYRKMNVRNRVQLIDKLMADQKS